ncbi:MAG: glycine cleavage system aminomethyltransferase GcvT [Actinomycetota bacterium]|jgi:aminomethyltransferase|nr:glycine cleavage system aminomethyltransferase GcvT [Actinomycetota bacterium]
MDNRRPFLFDAHVALGAKVVPFGGWEMPLAYGDGTVAEHLACRRDAVVFDVSHLGTVRCDGPDMFEALQRTLTNDLGKITPGRAQYTHLLNEDGFVVDDIIVWWYSDTEFDVMPNASNTSGVTAVLPGRDVTHERCVLAVQGPNARAKVAALGSEFSEVPRFGVRRFDFSGVEVRVAGTGYTGEDGVEIAAPNEVAEEILTRLVAADITPAGLGARDTLRLEAALPLYGHELSLTSTTLEARLGWVLGWEKETFRGRDAVEAERRRGVQRHLTGVVADGRQPLRDGGDVIVAGESVGTLTSGNFSPVLERGIGLGLLSGDVAVDTPATVVLRGREIPVTVTALPFVRKASSRG